MSTTPDGGDSAALRTVSDPMALRALAHPIRIGLLEEIALRGPLTATEAAELVGGSASNVAYHLRTLAKYGYLVEADGGSGRERPWKLGARGFRTDELDPDPVAAHAARGLGEVMVERWLDRLRRFRGRRHQYPAEQQAASASSYFALFATPAEAEQVQAEVIDILMRYSDRISDPGLRPEGSVAFDVLLFAFPSDAPDSPDSPTSRTSQEK